MGRTRHGQLKVRTEERRVHRNLAQRMESTKSSTASVAANTPSISSYGLASSALVARHRPASPPHEGVSLRVRLPFAQLPTHAKIGLQRARRGVGPALRSSLQQREPCAQRLTLLNCPLLCELVLMLQLCEEPSLLAHDDSLFVRPVAAPSDTRPNLELRMLRNSQLAI